jgi:hypothetical protein
MSVSEWLSSSSHDKRDLEQLALEKLSEKAVVQISSTDELRTQNLTNLEKELLANWVQKGARIAISPSFSSCDYILEEESKGTGSLISLLNSEKFTNLWELRSRAPEITESSEGLFKRMFEPLLRICTSMTLVDKWFFDNFGNPRSGGRHLVSLLMKTSAKVRIYTSAEDSQEIKRFQDAILEIRRIHKATKSEVEIDVIVLQVSGQNPLMHDRVGYFVFSLGKVAFQLGKGTEWFRHGHSLEPKSVGETKLRVDQLNQYLDENFKKLPIDGLIGA